MATQDRYGVAESGNRLHILWEAPRAWCGVMLDWLDPDLSAPGCPREACKRCQRARNLKQPRLPAATTRP